MQAKEYLTQVEKLDKLIENKLKELEQWESMATGISSAPMGAERVQSSGNQQKMADAVYKIVELKNDINRLVDTYIDIKQGVIHTIEHLSADEYDVLHKMYIQRLSMREIADMKGKSYKWVKGIHRCGIKNIQEALGKKVTKVPQSTPFYP